MLAAWGELIEGWRETEPEVVEIIDADDHVAARIRLYGRDWPGGGEVCMEVVEEFEFNKDRVAKVTRWPSWSQYVADQKWRKPQRDPASAAPKAEIDDFEDLLATLSLLGGKDGFVIVYGRRSNGEVPSATLRGTLSDLQIDTGDVPAEDEGRRLAEFSIGEDDRYVISIDSADFEGATRNPSELEVRLEDLVIEFRFYEAF